MLLLSYKRLLSLLIMITRGPVNFGFIEVVHQANSEVISAIDTMPSQRSHYSRPSKRYRLFFYYSA